KDVSFESPQSPQVFTTDYQPKVGVQLNNAARRIAESDDFEVEITVTLTAEQDEKTVYLVEVKQAGIFTVSGLSDEEREHLLGAYCPNVLFPYARETIASLVQKGSFPVFQLQPINFEALYQQAKARRDEEQGSAAH
ncbi:MAG: protein-export chaperone SecB, partial [Alcanivoracaceae bacterium]